MLVGDLLSQHKPFFGELLVGLGCISYRQLEEAIAGQKASRIYLGEWLVDRGWISVENVTEALEIQQHYERAHGLLVDDLERTRALQEILVSISVGTPLDRVLLEIVRQVRSTLSFDRAGIYLLDAKTKLVHGTWGTDAKGEVESLHHVSHPLSADRGFAGIYQQDAPFFFTEDASAFYGPDSGAHQRSVRHKAIVPMKFAYDIVGFIAVDNLLTERSFGPDDLAPLQAFAIGAALAVSQARMSHALQQGEQALRASEARYRELFENANEVIYTHDLAGNFTTVNQAIVQLLGYTRDETIAMNIASLVVPEHLGRAREMIDRKLAGKGPTIYELEIISRSGRRIPLEISSRLIYEEGKPVGVQGIARDITERRRTDTLARVSQSLSSTLELDQALRTIWKEIEPLLHPDSFYARVYDPKRAGYLGKLHVDEGLEYDLRRDWGPTDVGFGGWAVRHRSTLVVQDTEAEAERLTSLGIQRAAPIGSGKLSRSLVVVPILSADEVLGVLGIYSYRPSAFSSEDVRLFEGIAGSASAAIHSVLLFEELRASNQQLRTMQDQLVQTERLRALGQMASGIAHDFNNALSPIMGFSELLLKVPENLEDKAKTVRYLQSIHLAAHDAARVVSRLREFYRLRKEGEVFQPVTIDRVIEQAVDLTQPKWKDEAQAKGVSILIQTYLPPMPEVTGNESELREALVNLIFNAVDAMPNGGTITIRTMREEGMRDKPGTASVVLSVQDTGAGMTEEVRRRCLEPFFTSKGPQGTGLGLSMVYGIIIRHEGTMDIASVLGQGTSITLRLPAMPHAQQGEPAPITGEFVRPLRVLVVDDDPAVREVTVAFLLADGHTVETATNGREGLEKFHAGRFDLIVTDRSMPELSGDHLALAIKQRAPSKPIIMLTGFGEFMSVAAEVPKGVDAIVSKPVTLKALRQAIVASLQTVSKT